jgi:hypothetical protein
MDLSSRLAHVADRTIKTLCCILVATASVLHAQNGPASTQPKAGSNWERVKALPVQTNLHITSDHGGKTCRIFAVTDDTLTCAKGSNPGAILQRAEIKHIKLTHYGRSTAVGAAIGAGIGATAGAIGGRTKPCPTGQTFCLNGLGIGAGGVAAIFGIGSGILGSAIGGPLDITRGSSIYTRP